MSDRHCTQIIPPYFSGDFRASDEAMRLPLQLFIGIFDVVTIYRFIFRFFVADFLWLSSDEHVSRFQESRLRQTSDSIFWMGKVGGRGRLLSRSMKKNCRVFISVVSPWKKRNPALNQPLKLAGGAPPTPILISRSRLDLSIYLIMPVDVTDGCKCNRKINLQRIMTIRK
ncbi:hypothetical protein J6590_056942 [Homalodisca vitripennis]|nr:hypothetical protein J6590_056942 [Homalodisca vitripennis]